MVARPRGANDFCHYLHTFKYWYSFGSVGINLNGKKIQKPAQMRRFSLGPKKSLGLERLLLRRHKQTLIELGEI